MNIQEYISSGIIESYVLGLASVEEQQELEQLCARYPEIAEAKNAFEISLEQHALANAVAPPTLIKDMVWAETVLHQNTNITGNNVPSAVASLPSKAPVRTLGWVKMLAAASVILLLASTALNFYFYRQYRSSEERLTEIIASNEQLVKSNQVMQTKMQQYNSLLSGPAMSVVAMNGQPAAPQSSTTVYWNNQTKDVYLMVHNLPKPAPGKQYQLWALVDGQPVDAGMLDITDEGLLKMKNIPRAQAFAITLENTGGSKTPTMPIYVMGQI